MTNPDAKPIRLEPMERRGSGELSELRVRVPTDVLVGLLRGTLLGLFERDIEIAPPARPGARPVVYRWRCTAGDTSTRDGTTWLTLVFAPTDLDFGHACPACGHPLTERDQASHVERMLFGPVSSGRVLDGPPRFSCGDPGHWFQSYRV